MLLLQSFLPLNLYICWDILWGVVASLQDKESSIVDNLHFRFDNFYTFRFYTLQFLCLSVDINFLNMFTNFNNVSRYVPSLILQLTCLQILYKARVLPYFLQGKFCNFLCIRSNLCLDRLLEDPLRCCQMLLCWKSEFFE